MKFILQEMDEIKKEMKIEDNPTELDAILDGTMLDHDTYGLSPDEIKKVQKNIVCSS